MYLVESPNAADYKNSFVYEILEKLHIEQSAVQQSNVGRQFFCCAPQHEEPIRDFHGTMKRTNDLILISFLLTCLLDKMFNPKSSILAVAILDKRQYSALYHY